LEFVAFLAPHWTHISGTSDEKCPFALPFANKGFAAEDLLFGFRCIALLDAR
jgi:hypothetical protein